MATYTEVQQYIEQLVSGSIKVPRLSLRTAQQYRTIWRRFERALTPQEVQDVSTIDCSTEELAKRLREVFPDVKGETLHAYAVGIARCINLYVESGHLASPGLPLVLHRDPKLSNTQQRPDNGPAATLEEVAMLRAENSRLRAEVTQLRNALRALVDPGV